MKGMINIIFLVCGITCACGLVSRIFKGRDAPKDEYLHHAFITARSGLYCGGSVIHKRWILTAAHCFANDWERNIKVTVGSKFRSGENGRTYNVDKKIAPEGFTERRMEDDIALLRVTEDIEFNDKVQPITLADRNLRINNHENVIISGFGRIERKNIWGNYILPSTLQTVNLKACSYQFCKQFVRRIREREICTLVWNGKGPCLGDSGGALVNENGIQVGIDSHSYGDCGEVPEIYTLVSGYRDWIDETIRRNS